MRHYEIVFMVHPDRSDRVEGMLESYIKMIKDSGGIIHRQEDWGRRQLAYPIDKVFKAHYILLNVEVDKDVVAELKKLFLYNDYVLRHLIMAKNRAITGPSPMLLAKQKEEQKEQEEGQERSIDEEILEPEEEL